MRKLGAAVHSSLNPLYFGVLSCIAAPLSMSVFNYDVPGPIDLYSFKLLMIMGLLGWVAQEGVSKALQIEKAGRAASINYLQVVVAFLADIIVFDADIQGTDIIGAFLIVSFTFLNSVRKCFPERK